MCSRGFRPSEPGQEEFRIASPVWDWNFAASRANVRASHDRRRSYANHPPKTAKQAAVEVLRRAGEPLKTAEIVKRVLARKEVTGLKGKTPGATIAAIIATENKKPDGLFERTAPGTYRLREPAPRRSREAAS